MLIIKKDKNGHKTVSIKVGSHRAFSIQTNGCLPNIHKFDIGTDITTNEDAWYEIEYLLGVIGTNTQTDIVNEYIVNNFLRD